MSKDRLRHLRLSAKQVFNDRILGAANQDVGSSTSEDRKARELYKSSIMSTRAGWQIHSSSSQHRARTNQRYLVLERTPELASTCRRSSHADRPSSLGRNVHFMTVLHLCVASWRQGCRAEMRICRVPVHCQGCLTNSSRLFLIAMNFCNSQRSRT